MDFLLKKYPNTLLDASGEAVGLPEGLMGNSEVGHLNIGAGRVVYQDITRISKAIKNGDFFKNRVLMEAIKRAKEGGKGLHLIGLLSDGGVHSLDEHLFALISMAKGMGVKDLFVHAFLDGRDTPPENGIKYVEKLLLKMKEIGIGRIATMMGRYYAMDRDNRWDRIEKAYRAMVEGAGRFVSDPLVGLKESYERGITDEFVEPMVLVDKDNNPLGKIEDGDSVISFNFRADRIREITKALTLKEFEYFNRNKKPEIFYTCMTEYEKDLDLPVAFPPITLNKILADVFRENGIKNLRIAETEKYAHVTYFFNGGVEEKYPEEDRILIPSPKIPTYDLKPEMSAYEVTERVLKEIRSKKYRVIILNYANPDMVGHTGNLNAAIKAIEAVDFCLGRVVNAIREEGGIALITADHGNAEIMIDPETGEPHTAHTTNKVPFILVDEECKNGLKSGCALKDIAPTILSLMGIKKPEEMTGVDLRE